MNRLYEIKDICNYFGISRQAVSRWVNTGKIKVIRLPSGRVRITEDEFNRMTESKYE